MLLTTSKISLEKTHYEILSVKEDASYDEIRTGYKAAALNTHPDKIPKKLDASTAHHQLQENFLDVQRAWEVLSDPKSRTKYDNELKTSREELEVVANEIGFGDMAVEPVGDVQELLYQCRCGDYFSVTSLELKEIGILLDPDGRTVTLSSTDSAPASVILPCGSCSLKVRLII